MISAHTVSISFVLETMITIGGHQTTVKKHDREHISHT